MGRLWVVWGASWGPLGPSWSVGKAKKARRPTTFNHQGKSLIFIFWGPVLGPLGVSFGPLGASWNLLGASWGVLEAAWRGRLGFSVRGLHLGPLLGPSWGPLLGILGRLGAMLEASWAVLRPSWASWGPLGASCGPLGAEGSDFRFVVPLSGPSWGRLWALLGRLGGLLGSLEALLGRLVPLLGASWAVLGRSWGLPGRLGASGSRKGENSQILQKPLENH